MQSVHRHIRPIRIEKDAAEIAVLIKTSFRPWLDHDNLEYLSNLEEAGKEASAHPFLTNLTGFPFSMTDVVCTDEAGSILGLITTNPFYLHEKKCCLLTNVCVSPSHRRQGIAAQMISEIIRSQREAGTYGLYLQTRMAEKGLKDFYKKQGFTVTDFRETWILPKGKRAAPVPEIHIESVPESEIELFRQAFSSRYPETVLWNLDYPQDLFRPGKMPDLVNRLLTPGRQFMRAIDSQNRTAAWAAIHKQQEGPDVLWFIPNQNISGKELSEALVNLCAIHKRDKPLKTDAPAGTSAKILQQAGFAFQQTLAWMWRPL